jgi:hypothetical protein
MRPLGCCAPWSTTPSELVAITRWLNSADGLRGLSGRERPWASRSSATSDRIGWLDMARPILALEEPRAWEALSGCSLFGSDTGQGPQTVTAVDRWRSLQTAAWGTAGARAEGTNAAQAPGYGAGSTAGRRECSASTCLAGSLRRRRLVEHGVRMRCRASTRPVWWATTHSA